MHELCRCPNTLNGTLQYDVYQSTPVVSYSKLFTYPTATGGGTVVQVRCVADFMMIGFK